MVPRKKAARIQTRTPRVARSKRAEKSSMSLIDLDVTEADLRLIPGWDEEVAETLRILKASAEDPRPRLVDTTMLYAPRSGGVKRYLESKKLWLADNRPGVAHSL